MGNWRHSFVAVCVILGAGGFTACSKDTTPEVWPDRISVFEEAFDSGHLHLWSVEGEANVQLEDAGGPDGSGGLRVSLTDSPSYIRNADSARLEHAFFSFWFHPNSAALYDASITWLPGQSVEIVRFQGVDPWNSLAALYVRQTDTGAYRGYVQWHSPEGSQYDFESGEFDLDNDWQEITLGFKLNSWIAVDVNGVEVRRVSEVDHAHTASHNLFVGQINVGAEAHPSGSFLFDAVRVQVPFRKDVWVDGTLGDDAHSGLSADEPVRTIQRGLNVASPGSTVHIQPGVYRETLRPATSGQLDYPVVIQAEEGPDTVVIRGSRASSDFVWTPLQDNTIGLPAHVDPSQIYVTDATTLGITQSPRFVVALDGADQQVERLHLAREPDFRVETEWKYHEYWWAADGGSGVAPCVPAPGDDSSCDETNRSSTELTDVTDDSEPSDIESGNLTSLGDLTGATLVAMDTVQAHSMFRRRIVGHDVAAGRITVDEPAMLLWHIGMGWGSKYYVENLPSLLDGPGEWWFDSETGLLYVWPLQADDPANLSMEISHRGVGVDLSNRSHVVLEGLTFEFFDGDVVSLSNGENERAGAITLDSLHLRYGNKGVYLNQSVLGPDLFEIQGFLLQGSHIEHMDTKGLSYNYYWGPGFEVDEFTRPGLHDTQILDNEFHHLAFRADREAAGFPVGLNFSYADSVRFERNHVHHVAHSGVNFWAAVDVSTKEYGYEPHEIRTGTILVKDNLFEKACQLCADCGALKIGGSPPYKHVFRDFLIMGNTFRDTYGWTHISEKRGLRWAGTGSDRKGMGGFGLYTDYASGIHAYRNIAYNNAYIAYSLYGFWRLGDMVYYNNVAANSVYGFQLSRNTNYEVDAINTQIVNNIIVNNEGRGVFLGDDDGDHAQILFDYNLYHNNGWRSSEDGGLHNPGPMAFNSVNDTTLYLDTVADIQSETSWEAHGQSGDPLFADYDFDDHDLFDGSSPDFQITAESLLALDSGAELPESLLRLIELFELDNPQKGGAWDLGYHEWGTSSDGGNSGGCATRGTTPGSPASGTDGLWVLLAFLWITTVRRRNRF